MEWPSKKFKLFKKRRNNMITHYRVDMRVVHGQTVTILKKSFPLNRIIVIDDEIAKDQYMANLYASVVPSTIKVHILNVERGFANLQKAEDSQLNYFVIFKSPLTVERLIKMGYRFKGSLTIGQQAVRTNAPKYLPACGNTEEEFAAIEYAHDHGTKVIFDPSCKFDNIPFEEAQKEFQKVHGK